MVDGLVDTTVLIDVLRGYTSAITWLRTTASNFQFAISPIVYMELVAGAQNKTDYQNAARLADEFEMIFYNRADMRWAMQQLGKYRLSHNVGIGDCCIASLSARLRLPLYTQNMKHMQPLIGTFAIKPY
jgi:predicted nucleic acid-binding protein